MKYRRIFSLRVRHEDTPCAYLQIAPRTWDEDGARAVERAQMIVRPLADGLDIVGPDRSPRGPYFGLPADRALGFDVRFASADAAHYTTLGVRPYDILPIYSNLDTNSGALSLAPRTLLRGQRPSRSVIAGVEIAGISQEWCDTAPVFTLSIPPIEVLWAYYVLASRPDGGLLHITAHEETALRFAPLLVTEATQGDAVGSRLAAQRPDRLCLRFTSHRAVTCAPRITGRLDLCAGTETLLTGLPAPSHHHQTSLQDAPTEQPRKAWFHIVEL